MFHVEGKFSRTGFSWHCAKGPEGERLEPPASWEGCDVRVRMRYAQSEAVVLADAQRDVKAVFAAARRFEFEPVCIPDRGLRAPEVAAARTFSEKLMAWATVANVVLPDDIAAKAALLEGGDAEEVATAVERQMIALADLSHEVQEAQISRASQNPKDTQSSLASHGDEDTKLGQASHHRQDTQWAKASQTFQDAHFSEASHSTKDAQSEEASHWPLDLQEGEASHKRQDKASQQEQVADTHRTEASQEKEGTHSCAASHDSLGAQFTEASHQAQDTQTARANQVRGDTQNRLAFDGMEQECQSDN